MKVNYNQFLAIVYADLFDFALSKSEIDKWKISGVGESQEVRFKNGLFFLKGREKLVLLRKQREKNSQQKFLKLFKIIKILKEIDTIEAIFVTGSLAVNNASKNSDIDLMIVTSPGTVWLTRLKLLWLLKKLKLERNKAHTKDRICTNMFLDLNHLEIKDKNLYTAHEIVQARCVFDRGKVNDRWMSENSWVSGFLPNAIKKNKKAKLQPKTQFVNLLEIGAFVLQYLYMFPKMTNEKVGLGFAFFHPVDGSKYFLNRFNALLKSLV